LERLNLGSDEVLVFDDSNAGLRAALAAECKCFTVRQPRLSPDIVQSWELQHGLGTAWATRQTATDVLVFDPDGRNGAVFASGVRNRVGLAIHPINGHAWCSTNERNGLGDDLPPDFVTRVRPGAFYGWPRYYIGGHEDPRHRGDRPDLADKVTVPDVLIQPHSAPLQMAFYPPTQTGPAAFPGEFLGDAFVALHGSENRAKRTGYKVVRIRLRDGVSSGECEDFLTGFVRSDDEVWGRPVGVAIAHDGALLVTEDGNGTIWRVAFAGLRR
jgi:glucose/arabinose dehydrogenase